MSSTTLSEEEIIKITGGYKRQSAQLAELHRQGYFRARRSKLTGAVVLEREHYLAVCAGPKAVPQMPRPKLLPA